MTFLDDHRDPTAARAVLDAIAGLAPDTPVRLMEVCGGHTHTIYRHGLEQLLPATVGLVHGPGCPVCVLPLGRVDDAIALAEREGVVLACFGDLLRVPGSRGSLLDARARGADVRVVYSPLDALDLAVARPERQVVFFAVGFETTAPSTARTVLRARDEGVANFSVFCNHVTIAPPLRALLDTPDHQLDGFIGPGHVSTVVGTTVYDFVALEHGLPLVVAGFEPLDVMQSVRMLVKQLLEGRAEVENQYGRLARSDGNRAARAALAKVFVPRPHFEWRGLGSIEQSGLTFSEAYARFDAERRFDLPGRSVADPKACQCGEVLKGSLRPWDCKVFGTACTPETPIGACMVSSEGACAAYYNYGRLAKLGRGPRERT
ncbi:MAG: hydrogenase formation protein HypD [Acidimicrobiales bacterium]|nr:hydrogenase formation protein HypD [Acidimicrobiales bacterium]